MEQVIQTSKKTTQKRVSSIRPEIIELVNEMKAYKDGKLSARSFNEFIRTV